MRFAADLFRVTPSRLLRVAAPALVVAVAAQSAGNLVFHAVVGRVLSADAYGALGAVLAALTMLGVPLGALQAAASALAADQVLTRQTIIRILRTVTCWSLLPAAAVLVAAPGLQGYFRLGSMLDAAQAAPYLVVAAALATARGLLLGQGRVPLVAATYLAGTTVRLALGLALVGPVGVGGALAGTLVGEVAALGLAVGALHGTPAGTGGGGGLRLRAVSRAAVAVTGLFALSTIDLLLARHYLRGAESGAYVAAATVAKTVLALPAAVVSAVFPRLVAAWPGQRRRRSALTGVAAVVAPALAGAACVALRPDLVLGLLYGNAYPAAGDLLRLLATIAAVTSVVTVLTYAALARCGVSLLIPWVGAIIEGVLIASRHDTATQIALGSAAALAPTLIMIVGWEARAWWRGPTRHGPTRHEPLSSVTAPPISPTQARA